MRSLQASLLACGVVSALGCAHPQAVDTPLSDLVTSYRSVRAGTQPVSVADGVQFCAAADAVEVVRTRARDVDDWADKFRDDDVQDEVRDLIRRDPTLAAQRIDVRVDGGEAILSGAVSSDADAVVAARDALGVAGVIAVQLRAVSSESPSAPRLAPTACQ